jgi:hypothetical protein
MVNFVSRIVQQVRLQRVVAVTLSKALIIALALCSPLAQMFDARAESTARVMVSANVLPNAKCRFGFDAEVLRSRTFESFRTLPSAADVGRLHCSGHVDAVRDAYALTSFRFERTVLSSQNGDGENRHMVLTITP